MALVKINVGGLWRTTLGSESVSCACSSGCNSTCWACTGSCRTGCTACSGGCDGCWGCSGACYGCVSCSGTGSGWSWGCSGCSSSVYETAYKTKETNPKPGVSSTGSYNGFKTEYYTGAKIKVGGNWKPMNSYNSYAKLNVGGTWKSIT